MEIDFLKKIINSFLVIVLIISLSACDTKEFKEKPVDNYINNFITGGNLVRIDNTLYYNYQHSGFDYGLLKITKNSKKKIYNGQATIKDEIKLYESIYTNGECLFRYDDDINLFYEYKNESWKGREWKNVNKDFYISTDRKFGEFDLCSVETNEVIHKDIIQFYPYKSGCIFACDTKGFMPCEFYYFDNNTKATNFLGELKEYLILNFIIEDDFLIFDGYDVQENYSIYYLSISDFNNIKNCINQEKYYGFNVFNSTVYICSDNGIINFNLNTKKSKTICNNRANECYILDNKYIYFNDFSDKLYRINLRTSEIEIVFS